MRDGGAEVVIAGASFAGLAAARALNDHEVVVVDPHPVGAFPKSACALPLDVVEAFGGGGAVLERHDELLVHVGSRTLMFPLGSPYVTVDYRRFCESLAAQCNAAFVRTRALGYAPGRVLITNSAVPCRFAVDATGPAAVLATSAKPGHHRRHLLGAGLETELPRPPDLPSGLHFHLDQESPPGYAWAFGCDDTARFGVGVFHAQRHARDLKRTLTRFLERFDLRPGPTHGGLVPLGLREPVMVDLFVVGDAAGQTLPLAGEGIRPALHFGTVLGSCLDEVLAGRATAEEARAAYRDAVTEHRSAYRALGFVQHLSDLVPLPWRASGLSAGRRLGLLQHLLDGYMTVFPNAAEEMTVSLAIRERVGPFPTNPREEATS